MGREPNISLLSRCHEQLPLFNQQQVPLSTLVWRMQSSPQVASSSVWISGPLYIIMSYPCQSGLHVMSSFDLRGADLCDERLQEWHSIPTNKNVLLPHRSWYTVDEFMLVQFSWNSRLLSRKEGRKEGRNHIYSPRSKSKASRVKARVGYTLQRWLWNETLWLVKHQQ